MAQDENNVVVESVAEKTAQTGSPQVEETPTESQTPKDNASPAGVPDDLPDDEHERRRAFQEQRQEIKRLKEESLLRQRSESAFAPFRQQVAPTANLATNVRVDDYTDPLTGEINRPAYNAAVEAVAARQAAVMAQQSVQDQLDEYSARQTYPELFKDPDLEQEIADRWFASKMRGESQSVSEIAERVAKRFAKAVSKAEKLGAEKALEQVAPKEQAALSAQSQSASSSRRSLSDEEFEKLKLASRGGRLSSDTESTMAVAARMRNIPWANK